MQQSKMFMFGGCGLVGGGLYLLLTDSASTIIAVIMLVVGGLVAFSGMTLFQQEEKAKENRRLQSLMRAVDSMPKNGEAQPEISVEDRIEIQKRKDAVAEKAEVKKIVQASRDLEAASLADRMEASQEALTKAPVPKASATQRTQKTTPTQSKSLSDLPSIDPEEDWGVYVDKKVTKK